MRSGGRGRRGRRGRSTPKYVHSHRKRCGCGWPRRLGGEGRTGWREGGNKEACAHDKSQCSIGRAGETPLPPTTTTIIHCFSDLTIRICYSACSPDYHALPRKINDQRCRRTAQKGFRPRLLTSRSVAVSRSSLGMRHRLDHRLDTRHRMVHLSLIQLHTFPT